MPQKDQIEIPSCTECHGRSSSIFCCLSQDETELLSAEKKAKYYKKGEVIFHEGDRGHGLYAIFKGKVKVHKLGGEAKEQIVRFANEGDILGYRSLLGDEPYNATATAIESCAICYLPKSKFAEVLSNSHDLSHKTIQLLTNDLRESEKKIINITQKPVIERISEALLILKKKFGVDEDNTLNIILTRREIGDLAGVTTETTIRTLSELNKQRVLNLNGKQIQLIDLPRLIHLANIVD